MAGFGSRGPAEISAHMAKIRSRNTIPELRVRQICHHMGYRFRLHTSALPGSPDLVFRRREAVIFVHGCFWHSHEGCDLWRIPKSRLDYWLPKLARTKVRDRRNARRLRTLGWRVMVIWECQLQNKARVRSRIARFLG